MATSPFHIPIKPRWLASRVESALGLKTLQSLYLQRPSFDGSVADVQAFLRFVLKAFGTGLAEPSQQQLNNIPSEGPVIIVCNHPLGGIEGIAMTEQLLSLRPDLKVLTNKLLNTIPELSGTFIGVNVLAKKAAKENAKGIKASCEHLKTGGALLVYPAGIVSAFNPKTGQIEDEPWNRLVGMLMRRFQTPVVPCYVEARNSDLFYAAGRIHPRLRTVLLIREMISKQGKSFSWRIGEAIPYAEVKSLQSDDAITHYLRLAVESLREPEFNTVPSDDVNLPPLDTPPSQSNPKALSAKLQSLQDFELVSYGHLSTYCVPYKLLGEVLPELACARERTFRAVGEGSGQGSDSDQFDPYYQHLFVWDHDQQQMVGGYRLGRVDEIIENHGLDKLYSRSLYQFSESYVKGLGASLEVGRSFVTPEYQRHPRALDMLWQGIGRYVAIHPEYSTLFGCVSISSEYSDLARAFLSESMMTNFKAEQSYLADIKPIKPLTVKGKLWTAEILRSLTDIAVINKLVGRFDAGKSVPVLLRHYLALNGRFICFGLNEQFQSSLDGLILVDLRETPARYLNRYMGKEGASAFLAKWESKHVAA